MGWQRHRKRESALLHDFLVAGIDCHDNIWICGGDSIESLPEGKAFAYAIAHHVDHRSIPSSSNPQMLTSSVSLVFLIMDIFLGISVAALAFTQASQAFRNLTTNEMANWYRYKYAYPAALTIQRQ